MYFVKNFFLSIFLKVINLFHFFKNGWKEFWEKRSLLAKSFYTFIVLSIFIITGTITAPGISVNAANFDDNSFVGILNTIGGGGLRNFSIVALGLGPFITASLIMQLLQTKIFPLLYNLSKEGPLGRKKINIISRSLTIVIGYIQAIVLIVSFVNTNNSTFVSLSPEYNNVWYIYFVLPLILLSGTVFAIFLGEQITNKGVGNGTSLIIFAGIVVNLPNQFRAAFNFFIPNLGASSISGFVYFFSYLVVYFLVIFIIAFVYKAERRIPIQQIGSGRSRNITEINYLPIKVNPAGVTPIIFALIVINFPILIAGLFDVNNAARIWIEANLRPTQWIGFSIFILITFIFAIIFGLQQSKVDKIAEDFNKNSTFIPGIWPGEQTENYLIDIVLRLSIFSAIYLSIIGGLQFAMILGGVDQAIAFGGTGIIILVTVSLETIDQLSARRKTRILALAKKDIDKQQKLLVDQNLTQNQAELQKNKEKIANNKDTKDNKGNFSLW